jgi:hypothetical protein
LDFDLGFSVFGLRSSVFGLRNVRRFSAGCLQIDRDTKIKDRRSKIEDRLFKDKNARHGHMPGESQEEPSVMVAAMLATFPLTSVIFDVNCL